MRALIFLTMLAAALPAEARSLKIATWNFSWLTLRPADDPALPANVTPKTARELAALAREALALRADIVAFQGVDDARAARAVFPEGQYDLLLARGDVLQHAGFAIRRGLAWRALPDLVALDLYANARLHLRAGAQIELGGMRLLSLQLKSGCRDAAIDAADNPACRTLGGQLGILRSWVDERGAAPFVILGDFGRVMDGADAALPLIAGDHLVLRATAGRASPCWGGGAFVDHLIAGGAARQWIEPDSLAVMVTPATDGQARDRRAGHCPVSVRLDLPD